MPISRKMSQSTSTMNIADSSSKHLGSGMKYSSLESAVTFSWVEETLDKGKAASAAPALKPHQHGKDFLQTFLICNTVRILVCNVLLVI